MFMRLLSPHRSTPLLCSPLSSYQTCVRLVFVFQLLGGGSWGCDRTLRSTPSIPFASNSPLCLFVSALVLPRASRNVGPVFSILVRTAVSPAFTPWARAGRPNVERSQKALRTTKHHPGNLLHVCRGGKSGGTPTRTSERPWIAHPHCEAQKTET